MKLHTEDPRLTAFLLGELPTQEAASVESAVAEDPALKAALRETEAIRRVLSETLPARSGMLLPHQRDAIRQAAAESATISRSDRRRGTFKPWLLVPLAAAAAVCIVVFIHRNPGTTQTSSADDRTHSGENHHPETSPSVKLKPAPADHGKTAANTPANPATAGLPALRARSYLAAAEFPTVDLPLDSGKSSLEWIRQSIITKRQLPEHNAVRLEEILNSFNLHPAGLTVVAKISTTGWHPDNRGVGATLSTETMACPWKPSASLVIICIRGNPNTDCDIKAVFRANAGNVRRYRLLGYSSVDAHDDAPLPTRLPARSSSTLAIEVEPSTPTGDIGTIEWSVNDQPAAPVTLARHGDAEPSDDARFASLVCTYAQWLVHEPGGLIDTELLAALARETASRTLSGDRADFLNLIDQSINL